MRSLYTVTAIFLLGLLVSSCKKPEDGVGLNLQPEDELLNANRIDTTTIIMYTEEDDSVRTDELRLNMVGSYLDPVLGKVEASTYMQLRTDGQGVTFEEDSIAIDSVVLAMEYDGYYGELNPQTFGVYEIVDTMYKDSAYYSNSYLNFDSTGTVFGGQGWGNLIVPGEETQTPSPLVNTVVGTDTLDPQIRIPLDTVFGRYIINSADADLATNEQFVKYFRGLHVRVENPSQGPEEGAVLYFNLEDAASKVTIYYTEQINGVPEARTFDLKVDDNSARFTRSPHNYSSAPVALALSDSTQGQFATHIQTLGGLRTIVNFPHIHNLVDSGMVAINKAELILPVEYYTGSSFFPNDVLTGLMLNEDGDLSFLPGGINNGLSNYDIDNMEYRFVISEYIQGLLKGEISRNKLILESIDVSVTANRCILSGPNTINRRKPQLILTYTNY